MEILDALKIKNFEGFYNLIFIVASFICVYYVVFIYINYRLQEY